MTRSDPRVESTVHRFIDHDRNTVIVRGEFGGLFAGYLDHVQRWETNPDDLTRTMMRQALGATALHLTNRPGDEVVAYTLNVAQPSLNLFIAGDAGEASVVGRMFTSGVRPTDISRFYVESIRPGRQPVRSTIEVQGLDLLEIFNQYFEQSEQSATRFFEVSDLEFVMIEAMPDSDPQWVLALGRDQALSYIDEAHRPLDEKTFRFRCGCSPDRMLEIVRGVYQGRAEELFRGDEQVEVSCPRCGRRWWVDRDLFDAGTDAGTGAGMGADPDASTGAGSDTDSDAGADAETDG